MLATMKNIVGMGDCWAPDTDGTVQIQEITATGQTSVQFTNVPAYETYGYMLYADQKTTADPVKCKGEPTFTLGAGNTYTVSYTLAKAATAAQVGTKFQLRILK